MNPNRRLKHGTLSGYQDHRCRCKRCAEVWDLYIQEYRDNIFDETKAKYKEVNDYIPPLAYSERIVKEEDV